MLLILTATSSHTYHTAASIDAARWTRVNIPTEGEVGNWALASGSDVRHLTMAGDGTLYAYGKDLTYTLYRSRNGGIGWSHIGNIQDAIIDIAVSPHDFDSIYYATTSDVYRSIDGGETFYMLPAIPGGTGTSNIEIASFDVTWLESNIIAVGTRDTDSSEFGDVYMLDEASIFSGWTATNAGDYDIYAVAFSPNYTTDYTLVAVVTDETDTYITAKSGNFDWGALIANARLSRDNTETSVVVAAPAVIAFPDNYDSNPVSESSILYAGINTGTGTGDVYQVNCQYAPAVSIASDMNIGYTFGLSSIDVTGLAACGDYPAVSLLAGTADGGQTYFSPDSGSSWKMSRKEPTGDADTFLLMAPDFLTTGQAYSTTSGSGSALSVSRDKGNTWNQLSLIDTNISAILDMVPSPDYGNDSTLFMITFGKKHSLWRSTTGGNSWERILSGNLANVDTLTRVELTPHYGDDFLTVFIAGESNGQPTFWKSADNGQNYRRRYTQDPDTGTAFAIDTWAVSDENTLFVGGYDDSNGLVYKTINSGFFYSQGVQAGGQSLHSMALSPDYENDNTILVGNTNGWVYSSSDDGKSFHPLPMYATSPPLTGSITVAFDPEFAVNNTIYAASDTAGSGVYRFVIGTSTEWESIDGTLPVDARLNQLFVSGEGVLYAANPDGNGGMERCLNPATSSGTTFDTVTLGLSDGATLIGLWQSGRRLWSIDSTNTMLLTFNDTLTTPVALLLPENGASGAGNLIDNTIRNIDLDWETLDGATSYQWQCDCDSDLSSVPGDLDDITKASLVRLPALEPATTYHWRVRASAPVLSPWSDKLTFTTRMDTEATSFGLATPVAGAVSMPVKPVFQWAAIAGADAYELLVSANPDFSSPVIIKKDDYALASNAWQCDVRLDNDTTYYWKVRAICASTYSDWSAASAFTTESLPLAENEESPAAPESQLPPQPAEITPAFNLAPQPTVPPEMQIKPPAPATTAPQPTTPLPPVSQLPATQDWLIYLAGGLVITIIFALIIIFTMVLKMRRF